MSQTLFPVSSTRSWSMNKSSILSINNRITSVMPGENSWRIFVNLTYPYSFTSNTGKREYLKRCERRGRLTRNNSRNFTMITSLISQIRIRKFSILIFSLSSNIGNILRRESYTRLGKDPSYRIRQQEGTSYLKNNQILLFRRC